MHRLFASGFEWNVPPKLMLRSPSINQIDERRPASFMVPKSVITHAPSAPGTVIGVYRSDTDWPGMMGDTSTPMLVACPSTSGPYQISVESDRYSGALEPGGTENVMS